MENHKTVCFDIIDHIFDLAGHQIIRHLGASDESGKRYIEHKKLFDMPDDVLNHFAVTIINIYKIIEDHIDYIKTQLPQHTRKIEHLQELVETFEKMRKPVADDNTDKV